MHTAIIQVIGEKRNRNVIHEAHTFDAKTKAAAISAAMRRARSWWTLEGELADFERIEKVDAVDGLTYIRLFCGDIP